MAHLSVASLRWALLAVAPVLMAPAMCGTTGPTTGCPASFGPSAAPGAIAVAPDGATAFVSAVFTVKAGPCTVHRLATPVLYVVDLAARAVQATVALPEASGLGPGEPLQLELAGEELVVIAPGLNTGAAWYATLPLAGPWTAATVVPTSAQPLGLASAGGSAFLLLRGGPSVLVHTPGQADRTIALPDGQVGAAIRAAAGWIEILTTSQLVRIDPATLAVVRTSRLGACPLYVEAADSLAPLAGDLMVYCPGSGVVFASATEAPPTPAPPGEGVARLDGSDAEPSGLASMMTDGGSLVRTISPAGFGATAWPGALARRAAFTGAGVVFAPIGAGVERLSLIDGTRSVLDTGNEALSARTLGAPRSGSPLLVAREAAPRLGPAVEVLVVDPATALVVGAPLMLLPPPGFQAATAP